MGDFEDQMTERLKRAVYVTMLEWQKFQRHSSSEMCLSLLLVRSRSSDAVDDGRPTVVIISPANFVCGAVVLSLDACIRISLDRTRSRYALFRLDRMIALCKLMLRSALASLAGVGIILWAISDSSAKPSTVSTWFQFHHRPSILSRKCSRSK